MQLHGGLMFPILFIVASCPLTLRARKVAPLIEDDWARRPHRAADMPPPSPSLISAAVARTEGLAERLGERQCIALRVH
ncbi:hypothetical protein ALC62_10310 [Cyphomyrmex costatus]|uniref:Secreted protein n=1 Tax=Cyphomyrmex costatus TaxID=456900 RepID=A0A151IE22_9HYME|nr:hypothetical protein ALC62_10310 [Cyphomyrmex costatus]